MSLAIIPYGNKILRTTCDTVLPNNKNERLIKDMWATLDATKGVGLAAPQVNKALKLFVVDSKRLYNKLTEEGKKRFWGDKGIKETFLNAEIIAYSKETWIEKETCLSLPRIAIDVERPVFIKIKYQNADMEWQEKEFGGMTARIIQHEYDHTLGKLHIDNINKDNKPLLYNMRVKRVLKGKVYTKYKMDYSK